MAIKNEYDGPADGTARMVPADATMGQVQGELAALRAEVAALKRPRRRPRSRLPLFLATCLLALMPLATLAAGPFNDLNPGSVHNADIEAIAAAGITKGCDPGVSYCPNGAVTREEMASFLARLGGLGANPPVANAKTAQSAATAQDAALLGGRRADGLARVTYRRKDSVAIDQAADVVMLTIEAPAAGFVLVSAATQAYTFSASGCLCQVNMSVVDRSPGGGATSAIISESLFNGPGGAVPTVASLGNTHVFVVAAPGTRTYAVRMERGLGSATIKANAALTALYVPFGATGTGELGIE